MSEHSEEQPENNESHEDQPLSIIDAIDQAMNSPRAAKSRSAAEGVEPTPEAKLDSPDLEKEAVTPSDEGDSETAQEEQANALDFLDLDDGGDVATNPPAPIINISADSDEYTRTDSLDIDIPDEIVRPKVPPPIYSAELKPKPRPTLEDPDATEVSPDAAFPGGTKLDKDLPRIPRRQEPPKPTPPVRDSEPDIKHIPDPYNDLTRPYVPPKVERFAPQMGHQPPAGKPVRDSDSHEIDEDATRRATGPIRQQPQRERPDRTPQRDPARQPKREQSSYYQKPAEQIQPRRQQAPRHQQSAQQPVRESQRRSRVPQTSADFRESIPTPVDTRRNRGGCLRRIIIWSVLLSVLTVSLGIIGLSAGYIYVAQDLPSPNELKVRASDIETAFILDRNGNEMYQITDPQSGNRTQVSLAQIADVLEQATIATEDARFYTNPGFDPIGIMRAIIQAYQEGEIVSGASTITQQLARALLLDEEERSQRTFLRKVREIILAAEINRRWPKEDVLELYLNEINYGNRAYGIEAAAQTYFKKSAAELSLSEAAILAGLPQAPALWDPYTSPDKAIGRMWEVLTLMVNEGYVTQVDAQAAIDEMAVRVYEMSPPAVTINHPHAVFYVLQQLEEANGSQAIYRGGGLRVYTTIDPNVQQIAEQVIAENRASINAQGADNASLIAINPETGEVLAMVGSVDFNDESISGQINMAVSPRQPGSTIKPFVYLAAMQAGWNPATLIWDIPTQFPDAPNPPYSPKNYDDRFHGPMLLREALGNSYNVTAVKALEFVGTCEFIDFARNRFQLLSLDYAGCLESGRPSNHGLSLALGGGEITPIEMVTAYSTLANQGLQIQPFTIQRIEKKNGEVIFERDPSPKVGVIPPQNVHLITNILTDNNARQPSFGLNNNLMIPGYEVAAKTGTSGTDRFDVRDGWTIGYTSNLAAGVWVGNTDNRPVAEGSSGYSMASPIWNAFMTQVLAPQRPQAFARPDGIVELEICTRSGTVPDENCPERQRELFNNVNPPASAEEDFLRRVPIDLWTGLRASGDCGESVFEASFINVQVNSRPEDRPREEQAVLTWLQDTSDGRNWAIGQNLVLPSGGTLALPPSLTCDATTPRPVYQISSPSAGQELQGVVDIIGKVSAPSLVGYRVDWGISHSPEGWEKLIEVRENNLTVGDTLMRLDTSTLPPGPISLKLTIFGPDNPYTPETDNVILETQIPYNIAEPTPTPTPTATETPVPTETPTETPTLEPTVTDVPPTATNTPPDPTAAPDEPTVEPTPTLVPVDATPTEELPDRPPEATPEETPEG